MHLKMMRMLFLCLLLLLPAAAVALQDLEGSADDPDDEDFGRARVFPSNTDKATGVADGSGGVTLIIIVVAAVVLTLTVAAVVAVFLVRRHMRNLQPGIYSVPTEQNQKEAI